MRPRSCATNSSPQIPRRRFTDVDHRELLLEFLEDDRDPLRWSAVRVEQAIDSAHYFGYRIPLEVVLDFRSAARVHTIRARAERDSRRTNVTGPSPSSWSPNAGDSGRRVGGSIGTAQ
jgi:hypothetical protein